MNVVGKNGSQVLFSSDDNAVIIDVEENVVVSSGKLNTLVASANWEESNVEVDDVTNELAYAAIASLDVSIVAAGQRLYTIPKGAQEEAKRALEWRKEHKRGGTPVGLNTARTLAGGGQIGIQKIRHIAKYFPRHEVDKKAEGYSPGEKGFPSNGRIAWALWGGDTAWRWARAIVERENKKALKADGFASEGYYEDEYDFAVDTRYNVELDAFRSLAEHNLEAVEFIARIRMDGTGIDRLYKMDENYNVQVWDDGFWHTLEGVDSDLASYDLALDDPEDATEKTHVEIDTESALFLSACFQEDPFAVVSLFDIDEEEASLVLNALDELDFEFLDRTLTAASTPADPGEQEGDGDYTPEERSAKAKRQVRDKTGRFAKVGSRVVIGGDASKIGNIIGIDGPRQSVRVELDTGDVVDVPAVSTQTADSLKPTRSNVTPIQVEDLDTRGILGEPRTPIDRPDVQIPGTLPAMDQSDIGNAIGDWNTYVNNMRSGYKPQTTPPAAEKKSPTPVTGPDQIPNIEKIPYLKDLEKLTGITLKFDPYKHPVLERFLNKKVQGSDGKFYYPNKIYYQPVIRGAAAKPGESFEMTPENSDVQPVFFAIVSETDPSAVYELVALVPASSTSNDPMTYIRKDKKWIRQEQILADMKSPTPPPVVPLDAASLKSVVEQIDGIEPVAVKASVDNIITVFKSGANVMMLTAAGGADRNRGNAEKLRRYWTIGKGGVIKIRWNTPGDWTRCYRNLKKYLGPRAKGYCALRHKEMTGTWPGDKNNIGKRNSFASYDEILDASALAARANDARIRVMTAGAEIEYAEGGKFTIPLVIPEELESGDGRRFTKGALEMRELPLPLMWQIKSAEGHNGSVVVGRIDKMERVEKGIGNAEGVFDSGAYGQEAERLVREGFIRGVSADLDQFEASQEVSDNQEENAGTIGTDKLVITHARVMAVTLVPKPAFQECQIYLATDEKQEETVLPDGVYTDEMDAVEASALVACGLVAGSIPVVPPRTWFDNPNLDKPTPLTVDDDGRVFGHIAAWHVDHIGMSFGTKPPRSKSNYAYFHTGVVRTDDGTDVPVGQLTLAGGHASLEASAQEAVRHYDDTASAIADVHAGEDAFGIWVSGALRPGTTPEQVRALRASAPSGDWRPIAGRLELVAVCQVNVPGFPIARARVASGAVMALVAAGASVLARMKSDPVADLAARVQKLEQLEDAELSAKADAVREKFTALKEAHAAELSARADALYARVFGAQKFDDEFGYISREKRQQLAKKGYALPDGSYPITSVDSLKDSIQAYGRSKPGKRAAVRRHIMKRARQLDRADLIPDQWKSASAITEDIDDIRQRAAEFSIEVDAFADISAEARKKLAEKGMALPDGSYPIRNEDDLKNAIKAYGRSNPEDRAKVRTHIRKRARALGKEDLIPENWKAASIDEEVAEDLGKALAAESQTQGKYTPETQPRDAKGKFRQVLARIKQDLGDAGLDQTIKKIEEAENLDDAGNYLEAARAAGDVISIVDRIDTRALNPDALENIRSSTKALGEAIANLPLPFGSETEKIRYSDLPPALKGLIDDMISRVEKKIGKDESDEATKELKAFMSGGDYYSQSEISSQMSKLLRLLT
jgi:hypothetical protein